MINSNGHPWRVATGDSGRAAAAAGLTEQKPDKRQQRQLTMTTVERSAKCPEKLRSRANRTRFPFGRRELFAFTSLHLLHNFAVRLSRSDLAVTAAAGARVSY